jgi:hypothetical protein
MMVVVEVILFVGWDTLPIFAKPRSILRRSTSPRPDLLNPFLMGETGRKIYFSACFSHQKWI